MRDGEILSRDQRQSMKIYQLYRSMGILECRVKALEMVLSEKWGNKDLMDKVNDIHKELIEKINQDVKEATEKAQAEAKKPKLTLLKPVALVLLAVGILSGCELNEKAIPNSETVALASPSPVICDHSGIEAGRWTVLGSDPVNTVHCLDCDTAVSKRYMDDALRSIQNRLEALEAKQ